MQWASNKGDARVPEGSEVLHCLTDSVLIVDPDIGDARDVGPHIDEYQRYPTETKVLDQHFFHPKGQDRHTIDASFDHAPDRRLHSLRVMHRRGKKDLIVIFDREVLEGLYNLREERISDFRDDQAENAAPSRHQSPSLGVGEIAELVDDLPHPLGKLGIDGGNAIDGTRYRSSGNLRSARDFTNIHALLARKLAVSYHSRAPPFACGANVCRNVAGHLSRAGESRQTQEQPAG